MTPLPRVSASLKNELLGHALGVADWMVRTQVRLNKPFWDANVGRFIYTRKRDTGQTVLGVNWTQARGIMVLLTAWQVTRKEEYRQAAQLAADYLRGMQQVDSPHPPLVGAIWEEIPYSAHVYVRDTSEVAETFCYLWRATGDEEWLWRAQRYFAWYMRFGVNRSAWPYRDVRMPSGEPDDRPGSYQIGNGKFLYRLWQATGKTAPLNKALRPIARRAMEEFFSPEGGIYADPAVRSAEGAQAEAHHGGRGSQAHLTLNDDGAGVTLLGFYRATGQEPVLEQLKTYANWILAQRTPLPTFSGYVSMANFMLDMHRQTGSRDYLAWVLDNLNAGLLRLRITGRRDPDRGAFRGEDEPARWYWGGRQEDYVNMRTNAYAAMVLLKLAAPRDWCPGYSAFGWDELKPWPKNRSR